MIVKLTSFDYEPGSKWDCGHLNLKADTPLGPLTWDQRVPGPRHGEDHAELVVTLAGHVLDPDHYDYVDLEPPNKEGKWARRFAENPQEVAEELSAWFEDAREGLQEFLEKESGE